MSSKNDQASSTHKCAAIGCNEWQIQARCAVHRQMQAVSAKIRRRKKKSVSNKTERLNELNRLFEEQKEQADDQTRSRAATRTTRAQASRA